MWPAERPPSAGSDDARRLRAALPLLAAAMGQPAGHRTVGARSSEACAARWCGAARLVNPRGRWRVTLATPAPVAGVVGAGQWPYRYSDRAEGRDRREWADPVAGYPET